MSEHTQNDEPLFEEFDHAVYSRCSNNNMPMFATFVPLSENEQTEVDEALALS